MHIGYENELGVAKRAAVSASRAIMAIFETAQVRTKADGSPVTDADLASDRAIREVISESFPDDAILTEEGVDDPARLAADRCWIVDPIDGTAAFVAKVDDFDVYIALVVDRRPVVAVTVQPMTGLMLSAVVGQGAWVQRRNGESERLRYAEPERSIRIGTRTWLGSPDNLPLLERVAQSMQSPAFVIDANVGLNVRSFVPPDAIVDAMVGVRPEGAPLDAWEWDLAAVDLIVREAGGCATDIDGQLLVFNKPRPRIGNLVLSTSLTIQDQLLSALATELSS